jgi:hypothetical protein
MSLRSDTQTQIQSDDDDDDDEIQSVHDEEEVPAAKTKRTNRAAVLRFVCIVSSCTNA